MRPGQQVEIVLAGHQIAGIVQVSEQGDYLQTEDGTTCGLCARMRVVSYGKSVNGTKLGAWMLYDRCWIDQHDGEALVGHHFALLRLPASSLPGWLQLLGDGTYEYSASDGHVLREEEERARWLRMH